MKSRITCPRLSSSFVGVAALTVGVLVGAPAARAAPITTFGYTGSVQSFLVGTTGDYLISAFGAQGGNATLSGGVGGLGASVQAEFTLTAGTNLSVTVGGAGTSGGTGSGGGGGSFVYSSASLLLVAGGGGGAGTFYNNSNGALTGQSGGAGQAGTTGGNGSPSDTGLLRS